MLQEEHRKDGRSGTDVRRKRKHQWNKGPINKPATTSEEGEDIRQDPQENRRAGGDEANSRNVHQTT
jgi:hypothetical protein